MNKAVKLLAVLLILLISLTACTTDPAQTETVASPGSETGGTGGNVSIDVTGEWALRPRYSYGAFSNTGYYYLNDMCFLYYYDTASGISVRLCSDVSCKHEDEPNGERLYDCEAFLGDGSIPKLTPMFFWNDRLYYVLSDYYGMHVYSRNAIGTDVKEITILCEDYLEKQKSVYINEFIIADEMLYFTADITSTAWDETIQADTVIHEASVIRRLNLSTGKEESIATVTEGSPTLRAASANAVFYFNVERIEEENGDITTWCTAVVKSTQSDDSAVLWKKLSKTVNKNLFDVRDGAVYIAEELESGDQVLVAYDLLTGEAVSRTDLPQGDISPLTETCKLLYTSSNHHNALYNTQTGETLPDGISGPRLMVYNCNDIGFIVERPYFANENMDAYGRRDVCYCTFAALEDGLQDEDLILIYQLD